MDCRKVFKLRKLSKAGFEYFSLKRSKMKNLILLILLLSTTFFNCKNASKASEKKVSPTENAHTPTDKKSIPIPTNPKSESKASENQKEKIIIPSEEEGVDFWTSNDCTMGAPEPIVPKEKRPESYYRESRYSLLLNQSGPGHLQQYRSQYSS